MTKEERMEQFLKHSKKCKECKSVIPDPDREFCGRYCEKNFQERLKYNPVKNEKK